jgi:hypothetical protein
VREIAIEVLVDDSPASLRGALDSGMTAATLVHPWKRTLCEEEKVLCAPDWPTLHERLAPILAGTA